MRGHAERNSDWAQSLAKNAFFLLSGETEP